MRLTGTEVFLEFIEKQIIKDKIRTFAVAFINFVLEKTDTSTVFFEERGTGNLTDRSDSEEAREQGNKNRGNGSRQ